MSLRACRLGEQGFATYLRELHRLHVLSRAEMRGWLTLHGSILRAEGEPLDDGENVDEQPFAALQDELGES